MQRAHGLKEEVSAGGGDEVEVGWRGGGTGHTRRMEEAGGYWG